MPGSIGAKFAHRDRRLLSISGDAGFMMNVQQLETAVRLKLNGKHFELAFNNPDFAKLAESFGMWGRELTLADQIVPALQEAFSQDGPVLIAVPVDYAENMLLTKRLGNVSIAM